MIYVGALGAFIAFTVIALLDVMQTRLSSVNVTTD